jgi:hypothetical protein
MAALRNANDSVVSLFNACYVSSSPRKLHILQIQILHYAVVSIPDGTYRFVSEEIPRVTRELRANPARAVRESSERIQRVNPAIAVNGSSDSRERLQRGNPARKSSVSSERIQRA